MSINGNEQDRDKSPKRVSKHIEQRTPNGITVKRGNSYWTLFKVPKAFAIYLDYISQPYNTSDALKEEFEISDDISFYHIESIKSPIMEVFAVENESDLDRIMAEIQEGLGDYEFITYLYSSDSDRIDIDKEFERTVFPSGTLYIRFKEKMEQRDRLEFYKAWGLVEKKEFDFIDNAYNVIVKNSENLLELSNALSACKNIKICEANMVFSIQSY